MAKDYNDSDGRWVTISGRRVFIAEGQSLGDAMKKSGKFKNVKKVKGVRENNYKDSLSQVSKNKFLMGQGIDKEFVKGYAKDRQLEDANRKKELDKEINDRVYAKAKEGSSKIPIEKKLEFQKLAQKYIESGNPKDWDAFKKYEKENGMEDYVVSPDYRKDTIEGLEKQIKEKKNETPIKKNFPSNMSKEIYEMDVDKGNAWSGNAPTKNANGDKVMFVSKNGKSENTAEDIVREMQSKHPELNARISDNGNQIMFTLKKGDETSKERTYEQVNKEWKDQASKMEKNYKEFGGNTVEDEKKLNDLSAERDSMQYKLSSKEVKDANAKYDSDEIKQDVLENFGEDYDASRTPEENLRDQIDYMRNPRETLQQTCERYVAGGSYLVYNGDIKDYLDKHNIDYNEDNFFDKYKQTMGKKMVEIYNQKDEPKKDHTFKMNDEEKKKYEKVGRKMDNLTKELKNDLKELKDRQFSESDRLNAGKYTQDEKDILDRYSEDYGYDKGDNLKNLKGQIDYMRNPNESIHRTAERLVEGGDFLIYNGDVKDYLDERGIKYNEDNFFDKYKKDMADKIERLYNSESPKTSNKSMNESIREKAGKTKADRNIDAFDDTRDFDQKEYDRRWKGKEINYDKPGKVGNMDVKDYANQRKEYLGKVDKLYKDENYEGKYKKLSDKTKSGEMTKKQFYNARAKLVDAMQRKQNQISKDYNDEVVSNNIKRYNQESPVIKNAIKRMSESSRAKTQKARERLRNELSPKATERYGNSVKGRTQELRMFNAWKEYNQKHPNSQMTLETFKKKYKG